jgi:CheY-like chemotaxis protein
MMRESAERPKTDPDASVSGPGDPGESALSRSDVAVPRQAHVDAPIVGGVSDRARRILVVDDHPDAAETLAVLLRHAGHEVVALTDGRAAVEAASTFHPQIVILDIGLPDMSGFDVARQFRDHPATANAEIVAVSGYGRGEHVHRAREAGFSAYCVKPLAGETLRTLLDGRVPQGL